MLTKLEANKLYKITYFVCKIGDAKAFKHFFIHILPFSRLFKFIKHFSSSILPLIIYSSYFPIFSTNMFFLFSKETSLLMDVIVLVFVFLKIVQIPLQL